MCLYDTCVAHKSMQQFVHVGLYPHPYMPLFFKPCFSSSLLIWPRPNVRSLSQMKYSGRLGKKKIWGKSKRLMKARMILSHIPRCPCSTSPAFLPQFLFLPNVKSWRLMKARMILSNRGISGKSMQQLVHVGVHPHPYMSLFYKPCLRRIFEGKAEGWWRFAWFFLIVGSPASLTSFALPYSTTTSWGWKWPFIPQNKPLEKRRRKIINQQSY